MAQLYGPDKIATISDSYSAQLKQEHSGSDWGHTGEKYAGTDIITLLAKRPYIQTVLDFGAGKGSLGKFITSPTEGNWKGKWTNYDPGIPEYDQLPEIGTQYDLVLTSDVLEHIEPQQLIAVLNTLEALTAKVLYNNISCVKTNKIFAAGPYAGKDLHLIIEQPKWWRSKFQAHCQLAEFYYKHEEFPQRSRQTTRCTMIHERA